MVKRKDQLKELFSAEAGDKKNNNASAALSEGGENDSSPSLSLEPRPRKASGAVRAMGLSLEKINTPSPLDVSGFVMLDASKVDDAIIRDRLSDGAAGDEDFATLVASMREHGQQVPVLVRPHPDEVKRKAGFYQAAYGHRRIRACRELDMRVKALVDDLSDENLLIAQGKENSERRNLSFIERAFFAKAMLDYGFERQSAQAALGVHKSEMTRLLQASQRIPVRFVRAIGPAPKIGRPRWLALGDLFEREANIEIAIEEIHNDAFLNATSDNRFERLFKRLSSRKERQKGFEIKMPDGRLVGERKGKVLKLDKSMSEDFADYMSEKLPELLADFESMKS